jgi:ERCC4-type nuclease
MIISVDSREQLPYQFHSTNSKVNYMVHTETLPTGDYAVCADGGPVGHHEDMAIVERKTATDFWSTITHGRRQFTKELERMMKYGYAAVVIESSLLEIVQPQNAEDAFHKPNINPRAILATIIAFSQRYGVQFFFCGYRELAERVTFRILERWFRDHNGEWDGEE